MAKTPKKSPSPISPESDAEQTTPVNIQGAVEIGHKILSLRDKIEFAMDNLASLQQQLNIYEMETLPAMMLELQVKSFILDSGEAVTLKDICQASLPSPSQIEKEKDLVKKGDMQDRYERGMEMLGKLKAEALIRSKLDADLGKDSKALAAKVLKALKALDVPARIQRMVHPGSLSAWVRERLADGKPVDMDLFGVFTGTKAEIKSPKKKPSGTDEARNSKTSFI